METRIPGQAAGPGLPHQRAAVAVETAALVAAEQSARHPAAAAVAGLAVAAKGPGLRAKSEFRGKSNELAILRRDDLGNAVRR